jgi:hypothetical protein
MNVGANRQLAGEYGGKANTSTAAVTGDFWKLQCLTACTFSAVTCNITNFPTAVSIPAGTEIIGVFSSIAASAGTFIAHNRKY